MKKIIYFITIIMAISSCDLAIQKRYEFEQGVPTLVNFKDKTTWAWLNTQLTEPGLPSNGSKFDSLVKMIKLAGMESTYDTAATELTFLLCTNSAFIGNGGGKINRDLTGSGTRDMATVSVDRLRNFLRYHITAAYVDQYASLPDFNDWYYFQTLLPGETGRISYKRDFQLRIAVNNGAQIPSTTRRGLTVSLHNYVMKNGIAHQITGYVRYAPF